MLEFVEFGSGNSGPYLNALGQIKPAFNAGILGGNTMQKPIEIGERENIYAVRGDGHWYREKLYLTVAGEWQLVGYGEESTPYHGKKIRRIISKEEARLWASNVLGNSQWHQMFD